MTIKIETQNLTKIFSSGFSLSKVNLEVESGNTVCLLGKNGAGKSTLFNLLTGNLEPTEGSVLFAGSLMGAHRFELKRKLGYLPQKTLLPKWMTPFELLHYIANLHTLNDRKERIFSSLKQWDCESYAHRTLAHCSHGMQKRVALAIAGLYEPDYLFLDEPFTGLDMSHIYRLENFIQKRKEKGKINILSTHLAPYAAELGSKAFFLTDGKLEKLPWWEKESFENRVKSLKDHFSV